MASSSEELSEFEVVAMTNWLERRPGTIRFLPPGDRWSDRAIELVNTELERRGSKSRLTRGSITVEYTRYPWMITGHGQ